MPQIHVPGVIGVMVCILYHNEKKRIKPNEAFVHKDYYSSSVSSLRKFRKRREIQGLRKTLSPCC